MSELQLGLLAIGGVLVAGVFFYNKWQELKHRREAEASFSSRYEDVLMRSAGEAQTGTPAASGTASDGRIEPGFSPAGATGEGALARESTFSKILDLVVPIEAAQEVFGSAVLEAAATALADCSKPVIWEGFDEARAHWEVLRADGRYCMLRAGLQLVDRRGSAHAGDLIAFEAGVQQAAAAAGALATMPESAQALARAAELDSFCSDVDIQIALNVVSKNMAFTGTKMRALAEAAGLTLDDRDGRFVRRDGSGQVLYTLVNLEPIPFRSDSMKSLTTHGITLELDVPRAPRGTFESLRKLAGGLARALEATIVDDNRQPLGSAAFEQIHGQLQAIYKSMEARGISAGSVLALRLFS